MTPNLKESTLAVRIEVTEGKQYIFDQFHFELTLVEDPAFQDNQRAEQDLQNAWLPIEGQPGNLALVEESIKRINSLGYFEPLDRGDWEFVIMEQYAAADVIIRLTQRQMEASSGLLGEPNRPSYRILSTYHWESLYKFWVSVPEYLDRAQLKRTICELVSREKPENYERLIIPIALNLKTLNDYSRQYADKLLASYIWEIDLPDNAHALAVFMDAENNRFKGGPLFSPFDYTKECPKPE